MANLLWGIDGFRQATQPGMAMPNAPATNPFNAPLLNNGGGYSLGQPVQPQNMVYNIPGKQPATGGVDPMPAGPVYGNGQQPGAGVIPQEKASPEPNPYRSNVYTMWQAQQDYNPFRQNFGGNAMYPDQFQSALGGGNIAPRGYFQQNPWASAMSGWGQPGLMSSI